MDNIHHHWKTTDNPSLQKEVKEICTAHIPHSTKNISRQPAAITGIVLVLGFLLYYTTGSNFLGSLTTDVTITITDSGFLPNSVDVMPGQTIIWENMTTTPHIILSNTLCNANGFECLYTPIMFEKESESYVITQDTAPGTYNYTSVTSQDFNGTINVLTSSSAASSSVQEIIGTLDTPIQKDISSVDNTNPTLTIHTQNTQSSTSITSSGIPENPYAADSYSYASINTETTLHTGAPLVNQIPVYTHTQAPFQPASGMAHWLFILTGISSCVLLFFCRLHTHIIVSKTM